MPSAIASAAPRSGTIDRPFALLAVHYLRRTLEQRRQRRLDRAVAETVLALDHEGIADDFRAARRRW